MAAFLTTAGIGADTVLSGSNLTASQTNPLTYGGARADKLYTTGKWWFEVDLTGSPSGNGRAVGIVGSATPNYNQIAGNAYQSAVAYLRSGAIWVGGGSAGSVGCPACVAVMMVAVDLVNNKIWFKTSDNPVSAGYWNASATADPDTNVGGISIASIVSLLPGVYPVVETYGESVTFNFNNASSHILTPPCSFTIWGGGVPAGGCPPGVPDPPPTPGLETRHLVAHQGIPRFNQVFTVEVVGFTTLPPPSDGSASLTLAATEPSDVMALEIAPANAAVLAATEGSDVFAGEMVSVDLPAYLVDGEIIYARSEGDIIVPADSIKRGSENAPIQIPEETPMNVIPVTDL